MMLLLYTAVRNPLKGNHERSELIQMATMEMMIVSMMIKLFGIDE